ncbi:hypothetical protein CBB_A0046 [Clostridium botulinum Bf]|nr:hypothetical protein [Clostridium botulinum]EDT83777.1 hypothetical protein CBB_A0046 [Clostridium botulinum Bf]
MTKRWRLILGGVAWNSYFYILMDQINKKWYTILCYFILATRVYL